MEFFGVFLGNHECFLQFVNARELDGKHFHNNANRKSQSTTELEDRNLKFKTRLSFLLLLLASLHNSSISMNRLIKSICLVLIVFNLLNQSAYKRYIAMDIDDTNGDDSNESSSAASSSSSSSSSSVVLVIKPSSSCI